VQPVNALALPSSKNATVPVVGLPVAGATGVNVPCSVAVNVTEVLTALAEPEAATVSVVAAFVGVYEAEAVVLEVAKFVSPEYVALMVCAVPSREFVLHVAV